MAPLMTEPIQTGSANPDTLDTAIPMGTIRVIVPTEVPIARETKQLTTKSTTTANCGGTSDKIKYATLFAEVLPTIPTKIPDSINMMIIVIMFGSLIPFPISSSLSFILSSWFCIQATNNATRKITTTGIL